jgi:hypothetical protein
MKNLLKSSLLATFLGCSIIFSGCKKDDTTTTSTTIDGDVQATAQDRNTSAAIDDVITSFTDYASNIDPNSTGGRVEGTVLGAGQTSYDLRTKTLTIDFGTQNVVCSDGKKRRGKLFMQFTSGMPRQLDHTIVTTQENYHVEDIKVEGNRTDVVKVTIANNNFVHTRDITVQSRKLTFPDQTLFLETGTSQLVLRGTLPNTFEGSLTGRFSGTNRRSKAFTTNTSIPLKIVSSCAGLPPVSGKIEITLTATPTDKVVIDYGSGTCDRVATISYKGVSVTVNF